MTRGNRKRPSKTESQKNRSILSLFPKTPIVKSRKPWKPARLPATQAPASYLFLVFFVVALVSAGFVYHLHIRFEGVELGYKTSKARAERARLLVERRELRLELATLKSSKRIETEAREKLGMDMPEHDKIFPIGQNKRTVLASGRAR